MKTLTTAAASLVMLCATTRAAAREPAIGVTYEPAAGAACPSAESFRASVEKRAPKKRVVLDKASSVDARVELQKTKARVTVTAANGFVVEREVTGRSCAELANASALLVALFAEQHYAAAASASEPAAEEPATTEPEAKADPPRPAAKEDLSKPEAAERPTAPAIDPEPKHFALEVNPLSLLVNRFSAQVEWLPATHHALTVNPFYFRSSRKHTEEGVAYDLGTQHGAGAEVGYRLYTGKRGPNGFFVGMSGIVGQYWKSGGEPVPATAISLVEPGNYTAYGGALDLGGQFIVGPGVVIGFGAGAQYLFTAGEGSLDLTTIWEGRGGFSPRLLATLGYAF